MITDEERRNVAANIRSAAERRKYDLQDDPDYDPFAALYCVFCGVRGFPRYKDILHLADLIDPPTTPYICEKCGGEWPSDIMFERCPYCGTVIDDD